jgi:hypothetical protein
LSTNLNPTNRPVRTRMPGGVAGDVEITSTPLCRFKAERSQVCVAKSKEARPWTELFCCRLMPPLMRDAQVGDLSPDLLERADHLVADVSRKTLFVSGYLPGLPAQFCSSVKVGSPPVFTWMVYSVMPAALSIERPSVYQRSCVLSPSRRRAPVSSMQTGTKERVVTMSI